MSTCKNENNPEYTVGSSSTLVRFYENNPKYTLYTVDSSCPLVNIHSLCQLCSVSTNYAYDLMNEFVLNRRIQKRKILFNFCSFFNLFLTILLLVVFFCHFEIWIDIITCEFYSVPWQCSGKMFFRFMVLKFELNIILTFKTIFIQIFFAVKKELNLIY